MGNKSLKANAILNGIKTFITIVFPLLTYPYAARILGVENIGKVNYANSIVSYFVLFAGLGIQTYATREGAGIRDNQEEINRFSSEVFSINLISMLISYVVLGMTVAIIPGLHPYSTLFAVQSVAIFGNTIGILWVFNIFEDFKYITLRTFFVQVFSLLLIFIFVRNRNDYVLYAAVTVLSAFAVNVVGFVHARKKVAIKIRFEKRLLAHLKPILIIFSSSIATTIYVNSDIMMLGAMCGDRAVGLYTISTNVYTVLKTLLAAVILVALPRLSNYLNNDSVEAYKSLSKKVMEILALVVLPIIIGVVFAADEIVLIVGGKEFLNASGSLRILGISLLFSLFAIYMTNVIYLPRKEEKIILISTVMSAIVNVLMNLWLLPRLEQIAAAMTTLFAEFVCCVVGIWCFRKKRACLPRIEFKNVCFSGCILIIIVCLVANHVMELSILRLIIKIASAAFVYSVALIVSKNELVFSLVRQILNREKK